MDWLRGTNLALLLTMPVLVARNLRQIEEREHNIAARRQTDDVQQRRSVPSKRTPAISRHHIKNYKHMRYLSDRSPRCIAGRAAGHRHSHHARRTTCTSSVDTSSITTPSTQTTRGNTLHDGRSMHHLLPPTSLVLRLPVLHRHRLRLARSRVPDAVQRSHSSTASRLLTGGLISVTSILAVLLRQTNVVWVGFCAGQAVLARVVGMSRMEGSGLGAEVRAVLGAAFGRRRKNFWQAIWVNVATMLPMLAGCAWFIRWNGSIVLGDKSNHQAGLHLPQLGYFLAFASGFGLFPLLLRLQQPSTKSRSESLPAAFIRSARSAVRQISKAALGSATGIATFAAALAGFYIAVDGYTIEHPFLLADNRHYTFYLWRIFRRSYALPFFSWEVQPRYVMVPLYSVALIAFSTALGGLLNVLFATATAATLVPTPLIEPRYYLIPYVLLRVFCHRNDTGRQGGDARRLQWMYLGLEAGTYALVNVVTVGLFVGKPFDWPQPQSTPPETRAHACASSGSWTPVSLAMALFFHSSCPNHHRLPQLIAQPQCVI